MCCAALGTGKSPDDMLHPGLERIQRMCCTRDWKESRRCAVLHSGLERVQRMFCCTLDYKECSEGVTEVSTVRLLHWALVVDSGEVFCRRVARCRTLGGSGGNILAFGRPRVLLGVGRLWSLVYIGIFHPPPPKKKKKKKGGGVLYPKHYT